jgi:tRNA threonylcarbamoyladenosine biosynthesis protein TsaB
MPGDLTLALDAATYGGSVAVLRGGEVLASREIAMRGEHEERLLPAVSESLEAAGATVRDLSRVVCGAGPGSFTSLRIAASIAKGIAAGRGVPLYAVSSLALIVAGAPTVPGRYLAVLDAMRGELFAAPFEVGDDYIEELEPVALLTRERVAREARRLGASVIGPGEPGHQPPRAAGVARLETMLDRDGPVDLASWEPDYGRLAEAQVRWERAHGRPLPRA